MEVLIKGWEEVLDNSLNGEAMGEKEAPEKKVERYEGFSCYDYISHWLTTNSLTSFFFFFVSSKKYISRQLYQCHMPCVWLCL